MSLESLIIELLDAIKKINDRCEESARTGIPIYKEWETSGKEGSDTVVYKDSDFYELDYSIYQIRKLILIYIDKIDEMKIENQKLTGCEHQELISKIYTVKKMLFKEDINLINELDKRLYEVKKDNELRVKLKLNVFKDLESEEDEERKLG